VTAIFLIRRFERNRLRLKTQLQINQIESEKLKELDQMKTHFFTNISHEFRTPLTLILAPIKSLKKKLSGDKSNLQLLDIMESNSRKILKLTNEILDLSKIDAGKMIMHLQPCRIAEHIKTFANSHAALAESGKKKFQMISDNSEIFVNCDLEKIEKIVQNLIFNAIKYSKPGDTIVVSSSLEEVENSEDKIQLSISLRDSGIGIEQENLPHIFERYYQVETDSVRSNIGSGLGLSLVKELTELMGGSISVSSTIGKGSQFDVKIPMKLYVGELKDLTTIPDPEYASSNDKEPMAVIASTSSKQAKPILLIVEDHEEIRSLIRNEFSEKFQVFEAENGKIGLESALETIPDLIITDLMMPVMDGYTLCKNLKTDQKTSHVPVIMLTAKTTKMAQILGIENGADDYIVKPFDIDLLRSKAHNLVAQRKHLREKFGRSVLSSTDLSNFNSTDQIFHQSVQDELESHLSDEHHGVTQFSHRLGMSERQLRRKFKAIYNKTPNQYIRSFRLEQARILLEKNAGNVSEICYLVGFNNVSYFSKCFKEEFDISPSELVHS